MNALELKAKEILSGREQDILHMAECGHTDDQIRKVLKISPREWRVMIENDPDFALEIAAWKLKADERVEKALYERAIGYSHPDVHITNYEGTPIVTKITKHYAPDVQAAMFWLKNRKPDMWRDKVDVAVKGAVEHKHLHIVAKVDLDDRINALIERQQGCQDALS